MATFKADFSKALDTDSKNRVQTASDLMAAELIIQGHKNRGKLERSRELDSPALAHYNLLMLAYAEDLDKGISAATVRRWLSNRSERARYLNGLTLFFRQRLGGSLRFARTVAIRTSKVAARTGHPTPGSRKFSKTGKRTGFIQDALSKLPALERFPSFERVAETLPNR